MVIVAFSWFGNICWLGFFYCWFPFNHCSILLSWFSFNSNLKTTVVLGLFISHDKFDLKKCNPICFYMFKFKFAFNKLFKIILCLSWHIANCDPSCIYMLYIIIFIWSRLLKEDFTDDYCWKECLCNVIYNLYKGIKMLIVFNMGTLCNSNIGMLWFLNMHTWND